MNKFRSDGVPTYFFVDKSDYDRRNEIKDNKGNKINLKAKEIGNRWGNGLYKDEENYPFCVIPSKWAFDEFQKNNGNIKTYAIGVSGDINGVSKEESRSPYVLKYYAEKSDGKFIGITNGEELLEELYSVINEKSFMNVKITDVLSKYVELSNEDPDIKVTMKKGNKKTILYEKGSVTKDGKDKIDSVEVDGKNITAKFSPNVRLENGVTYTLSYNIETTGLAVDEYMEKGYGGCVGDSDTDFETNNTSSNKPGFFSNENATISYKIDTETYTKNYKKPVVQVFEDENTFINVEKIWEGDLEAERPKEIEVKLFADEKDTGESIKLSKENKWKASFKNLPLKKDGIKVKYEVKEESIENYESSIKYQDVKEGHGKKAVITNTYKKLKFELRDIHVKKIWDDKKKIHRNVTVDLYRNNKVLSEKRVVLSKDNNWEHIFEGLEKKDPNGNLYSYSVKEINPPKNYLVSYSGGENPEEIELENKIEEIKLKEVSDFKENENHVISANIDGSEKVLAINNDSLEWIEKKESLDDSVTWHYDSYRYLKNSSYYVGYKDKKLRLFSKHPKIGQVRISNSNLYIQEKSGKKKYFLYKDGIHMYKEDDISNNKKLKVKIYLQEKTYKNSVTGSKDKFYIVNKKIKSEIEIEKPKITKKIDYLLDNINGSDSYNAGKDDFNIATGTTKQGRDDYRLKLSLNGSEKNIGVDVLFVVDNTGSMTHELGSKTRVEVADEVINGTKNGNYEDGLLSEILNLNPKNKVAVTTFVGGEDGDYYEDDKDEFNPIVMNWTTSEMGLKPYKDRKIDTNDYSGTNYMGALLRANELINSPEIIDDDNFKTVIFVTDGEPNHYIRLHNGKHEYYSFDKHDDREKICVDAVKDFKTENDEVSFDCIGIGDPDEFEILKKMAGVFSGSCYTAKTSEELVDSFQNTISRFYPDHVEVIDPLSKYVELSNIPDLEIVREYKNKDGNLAKEVVWTMEKGEEFSGNNEIGTATDKNKNNNGKSIIKSVEFLPSEKENSSGTIHVKFNPEYKIGANNEFNLSFNVKVSEFAKKEFKKNGYPDNMIGDSDTDFDLGNVVTSSKNKGFY